MAEEIKRIDEVHPNVVGHRQRLADRIDEEERLAQEIRMGDNPSTHDQQPDPMIEV